MKVTFCRCGLSHKNKLSYEKFLSAFQDHRLAGYGRVTLDAPRKVATPVVFERHDNLAPDAAIIKLRGKISENPETIRRVRNRLGSVLFFQTGQSEGEESEGSRLLAVLPKSFFQISAAVFEKNNLLFSKSVTKVLVFDCAPYNRRDCL